MVTISLRAIKFFKIKRTMHDSSMEELKFQHTLQLFIYLKFELSISRFCEFIFQTILQVFSHHKLIPRIYFVNNFTSCSDYFQQTKKLKQSSSSENVIIRILQRKYCFHSLKLYLNSK